MGDSCQSYLLVPLTGDVFIYKKHQGCQTKHFISSGGQPLKTILVMNTTHYILHGITKTKLVWKGTKF